MAELPIVTRQERALHEVLVVDDNPATRYSTARVLRAAGFRTREAGTGGEALDLVASGVSAVILDVHLPDIDGFEVCGRIRIRPETALLPVIHLSASHVLNDDKVRGLNAGADAYMTHPAEPELLVATLQALIRARTAEEAMRRSDARFRAIYEQAPSGISLLDGDDRFVEVNPAMLSLLQRDAGRVVGRPLTDFAPPDQQAMIAAALEGSRTSVWRGEFPLLNTTGALVHVEWSLSANASSGGVLAIATDVSERMALSRQRDDLLEREQAARASAEELSRSKDEFIAVLSHELRTPLNAIVGWIHVLKVAPPADLLERGLAAIQRNAQVQTRLISDILDVSRIRLGKLPLELEKVDVTEVVRSCVAALFDSIREKSLMVAVTGAVPRPIVADPARLQQIISNLLTNAIKFSKAGGQITISLQQDDRQVTLTVADEGKGIEPDFLPLLFDRFTQSDLYSNRQHGGLGLGLSIVKQLTELHGGLVQASSDGLGKGARFVVVLPIVARQPQDDASGFSQFDDPAPSSTREERLAGLAILVVEDDADARDMLSVILRSHQATVFEASNYEQALHLIEQQQPDVLVSDIGMPDKDGYELIREVRRREATSGRRLPAIALTAFARPKDRDASLQAGFDAHCPKPVRPAGLMEVILSVTPGKTPGNA
jgi:PAS domain S-box-containing protein